MALKIYAHPVSQPSRAVLWLCMINDIPFEMKLIDPMQGQTRSEEFLKVNPAHGIPAIDDGGFTLAESHAIMTYLCTKHKLTKWYPTDLKQRAKVDEYLNFHHNYTRYATADIFRPTLMALLMKGKTDFTPKKSERFEDALKVLEHNLSQGHKFIVGDEPTIADLAAYCEFDQLEYLKLVDAKSFPPHVQQWINNMKSLPKHKESHEGLAKLAGFLDKKRSAAKL
eukprot:TRINITY_DN1683_c0_g1_i1.p1 TRINITY_DN1683_c0_g1~~TRINITY_DN1683_c0_g1_i1.p1  ORF type:complete len:225 (+),score=42.78 TRINITY_DN1683_c0_g1_i1:91-765(+)